MAVFRLTQEFGNEKRESHAEGRQEFWEQEKNNNLNYYILSTDIALQPSSDTILPRLDFVLRLNTTLH
jgi:hypothetical protein